jgi:hypothetical protein
MDRDHGEKGWDCVKDTSAHVGKFYGILCYEATVIAALTAQPGYTIDTDIYGESLPAGYYPMRIKSITLTSGACLALIESV